MENETSFPELNIKNLKNIARRWVFDHKRTDLGETALHFSRILLYHWATPYQKYYREIVPTKYAIVFELPYKRLNAESLNSDDPLEKFIDNTQYWGAPPQRSNLLYADFSNVYKTQPINDFYREWRLIPMHIGFKPDIQVRIDEDSIVLYDENATGETFAPSLTDENPEDEFNRFLILILPEINAWYATFKKVMEPHGGMLHTTNALAIEAFEKIKHNKWGHLTKEDLKGDFYGSPQYTKDIKAGVARNIINREKPLLQTKIHSINNLTKLYTVIKHVTKLTTK